MSDYAFRQQYLTLPSSATPPTLPSIPMHPRSSGPLRQLKQTGCHPELRETSTIAKKP